MSLVGRVARFLEERQVGFALIGAVALTVHGIENRATMDTDLLAVSRDTLTRDFWRPLADSGVVVDVRRGDLTDPLAGVVRLRCEEEVVDVVIGRHTWQLEVIDRAVLRRHAGTEIPAARLADLILLKLFAGGARDAWDVRQILAAVPDGEALRGDVEAGLDALSPRERLLWHEILERA